ncbi:MAG: hypothetical protein V1694_01535 [Candidatus Eisenbacteria bacterium]
MRVIDGPNHRLVVTIEDHVCAPTKGDDPEKWSALRELLISSGKYPDVSAMRSDMVNSQPELWPPEFIERLQSLMVRRQIRKVRLEEKE